MNAGGQKVLLRESLPLARDWAHRLCRHVDDSGITCAPFHEIWQILRYLDLNTTPLEHQDFLEETICRAIREGARRVLISGTADYAMLAVVIDAFAACGIPPDVTVMDVCQTPLRLCEWYAEKLHVPLRTVCSDILTTQEERPFDLICTHSFLGLFDADRRLQLARKWFSLSAPGGRLVSVNRLRPEAGGKVAFSPAQAEAFVRTTREKLAASDLTDLIGGEELAALARDYIRHRVVHPLRNEGEIRSLFETAGFQLEHLSATILTDETGGSPSGPTLRGGACYACFSARRPT